MPGHRSKYNCSNKDIFTIGFVYQILIWFISIVIAPNQSELKQNFLELMTMIIQPTWYCVGYIADVLLLQWVNSLSFDTVIFHFVVVLTMVQVFNSTKNTVATWVSSILLKLLWCEGLVDLRRSHLSCCTSDRPQPLKEWHGMGWIWMQRITQYPVPVKKLLQE